MSLRAPFSALLVMALTLVAMPPAPASATDSGPELAEVEGLTLTRFVLATEVVDREPVGVSTSFPEGSGIRAFLEVRNDRAEPVDLVVSFERVSQSSASPGVTLSVPPARRFRTHSSTGIRRAPGAYVCVVRLGEEVIARQPFEIVAR